MARWRNTRGQVSANFDQSWTENRSQDVGDLILVTNFECRLLDCTIFCPKHSSLTSIRSEWKLNLNKRKFLMKDGSFQNRQRCGQSNHIHRFISQLVLVSFKTRDQCTGQLEVCGGSNRSQVRNPRIMESFRPTRASRKSRSLLQMRIQDIFKIYPMTFQNNFRERLKKYHCNKIIPKILYFG